MTDFAAFPRGCSVSSSILVTLGEVLARSIHRQVVIGGLWVATALAIGGCGTVQKDGEDGGGGDEAETDATPPDARTPSDSPDGSLEPPPPGELGSMENPAESCSQLLDTYGPQSRAYWLRNPDEQSPDFEVYCEQVLLGGGWAMLFNSVFDPEGNTLAFWQFSHAERFNSKGPAALRENYYRGSLYLIGTEYVDIIEDFSPRWAVVIHATAARVDNDTLRFIEPNAVFPRFGHPLYPLYEDYFAVAGWSSSDRDNDTDQEFDCATLANDVAQHYSSCWPYNLGSDGDDSDPPGTSDPIDGGVGPHVRFNILESLGLDSDSADTNNRVYRITRFTRW